MTGSEILARALRDHDVDHLFFLMGGPMLDAETACQAAGMRMVDVRHEQAAAMMANAYARVLRRPGVCMAASGPGTTNLATGVAHAFVAGAPVAAIGGRRRAAPVGGDRGHPLLDHAPGPRRDPRGPPALLPQRALRRLPRGRPGACHRHPPELRDRLRPPTPDGRGDADDPGGHRPLG